MPDGLEDSANSRVAAMIGGMLGGSFCAGAFAASGEYFATSKNSKNRKRKVKVAQETAVEEVGGNLPVAS